MSCNSWNEALDGAHETLQGTLAEREHALSQREQALDAATRHLAEREQATAARAQALEESLSLAREQLLAGNRRADTLEATLQERDTQCGRLRARIEMQEADLRARLDSASAAHQAERTKLEARYAAAEVRWLTEVDRARQLTKESAKEAERQMKDLRNRVELLQTERDHLRQERLEARAELKTASAVREQLEARLRALANPVGRAPGTRRPKAKRPRKPTRTMGPAR